MRVRVALEEGLDRARADALAEAALQAGAAVLPIT